LSGRRARLLRTAPLPVALALLAGCLGPDPDRLVVAGDGGTTSASAPPRSRAPGAPSNAESESIDGATNGGLDGAAGGAGGGGTSGAADARASTPGDAVAPGSADAPGMPIPSSATCDDYAAAHCARELACNAHGLEADFGSEAACRERVALDCRGNFSGLPDTGLDPATLAVCVASIPATPCAEWRASPLVPRGRGCRVPGKRPDGAGCGWHSQCQSLRCVFFDLCGLCSPSGADGSACDDANDCQTGLVCAPSGACKRPGGEGAGCDAKTVPCASPLRCLAGVCTPPGPPGAACATQDDCDHGKGVGCNLTTRTCGPETATADSCDAKRPDGTVHYCAGGATCTDAGKCLPPVREGAACVQPSNPTGAHCLPPAECDFRVCTLIKDCVAVRPPPPSGGYPPGKDPWCPMKPFPVYCPARGGATPGCWDSGTDCSTVVHCNGEDHACGRGFKYDCASDTCN
jgi:hypothetical protein